MEKIAAKILSCELEKNNDGKSTTIKIFVSYGFQQYLHIPNEVDLYKFLNFFDVYKLSDVANKHCYVVMESHNNIVELQQFPHYGDLILSLRSGEIISEFERNNKLEFEENFKRDLKDELTKIKSSPKYLRKQIIDYFKKFGNEGISKSDLIYWLNSDFNSIIKSKVIETEFTKLLKENKIIGWGNTRAKRYANAQNYRKLCGLK